MNSNQKILNNEHDNNAFLDKTFSNLDLNLDMQKIYEIINDEELQDEFQEKINLDNLRNENYNRYSKINISKYDNLPNDFESIVDDIKNFYQFIDIKNILTDNYEDSKNNKVILDNIYRRISRLNNMIKSYLKQLTTINESKQKKFSITFFKSLDIDESIKRELIQKYNDMILECSDVSQDVYFELKLQLKKQKYIQQILELLNVKQEENKKNLSEERLISLNKVISLFILKYKDKIYYLEDLMPENSKHVEEFEEFKTLFNKITAYDDTDYENTRQTAETLSDYTVLDMRIKNFEDLFIEERNQKEAEKKFIYEKIGIKNLTSSLEYITANYGDSLSIEAKSIIKYINNKLNSDNYNIDELNKALRLIVNDIWSKSITDVYSYNPNEDFYFICSNNQFIDEKYQTILISKKEIERINDYKDYQIGFICSYDNNILYVTDNDDIMSVENDDMSSLKTPLQIEQEFINFKACNKIALDGYKTKIQGVYFINDNDNEKYIKAVELANIYKLPLIEIKKDNV